MAHQPPAADHSVHTLEPVLKPKAIAVAGASRTPGKVGHTVLRNLIDSGFQGRIVPVNPHAEEILGIRCHANPRSAGLSIDLGIIAVPAEQVMEAVTICARAGARALAVISAGFRESGPEGAKREERLQRRCRELHVRLLGPNCLGLINTANHMNASFARYMPDPGNISVLSQSGALCTAILDIAMARGFGLAKLVSVGNKADITETDFLYALADDHQTKVIVCYIESIDQGPAFIKAAQTVADRKPVVVLKAGSTAAGARAASSHTGSLAGEDMAYGAAFKRAGVIRAETFEHLFDFATALGTQPLPKGERLAIITNAGGPGIIAADAAERAGLEIPPLGETTQRRLMNHLPRGAHAENPVDILGDAPPDRYRLALEAVGADDAVDAVVVILTPQAMSEPAKTAQALIETGTGDKPLLAAFLGGRDVQPARDVFVQSGIPEYASPERAILTLRAMCDYANWRRRPPRVVTRYPVNRHRVHRIIKRQEREGLAQVGEVAAKDILRAYDFHVLPGELARSAEEAMTVADRIGYPVAMKIVSPDIIHKSDFGGVRLSLANAESVRDAYDLMTLRIGRRLPDAHIVGVYVERMSPPGREVILGMHRDPQFGPLLMFGLGGIFVEVMKDVSFYLAPITEEEAMEMLQNTRSFSLLEGARGAEAVDLQAIAGGLQRISQLATDFEQIQEMDINPLIVGEPGTRPVVADARMSLALEDGSHG